MNGKKIVGKWWEDRRLFQVKALPAFENNSHTSIVNMVIYCLNSKDLTCSGPNLWFYFVFIRAPKATYTGVIFSVRR